MSDIVIRAEGLGKKFLIGHQAEGERYTALRDVVARSARNAFRKASDLLYGRPIVEGDRLEEVWALRDVNFEVRRGEVLGIIGRNGAGKSTLLKILSRITEPSEGRAIIKGRVASLLEVGTGFHPELSGRENILLNGAILGMSRAEVRRKMDEIVAFAGVERYLDTPVKRFSSGMYVRLAFAVAAHLEPEILIIDEVLAVGDAEFQGKCLGKMREVSKGGRTVLFVSHNLAAIKSLTTRGLVIDDGRLAFEGSAEESIAFYTRQRRNVATDTRALAWGRGKHTAIRSARLVDSAGSKLDQYVPGAPLTLEIDFETDGRPGLSMEAFLMDATGIKIGMASLYQFHSQSLPSRNGTYICRMPINPLWLASGSYSWDLTTSVVGSNWDCYIESAVKFEVAFSNPTGLPWDFKQDYGFGTLALLCSESADIVPSHDAGLPAERSERNY